MSFFPSFGRGSTSSIQEKWRRGSAASRESKEGSVAYAETEATPPVPNKYGLHYFQCSMFATVLEDAITQLRILAECNNELRVTKTNTDINKLRAIKYSVTQPEVQDELDGVDRSNIGANNYKLDKLDNDKKYVADVLLSTYLDLSTNVSWRALQDKIQAMLDVNNRRHSLTEEETRNRITRRELMRQLRQQRNHIKSVTYDTETIIDNLKSQVEDAALNAEIRGRYIDNWQRARAEQHVQKITDVETVPTDAIEHYKQTIDREQRVHTEVELLINININETLQKIESWMNKYDKDIEVIEIKIQKKKQEHEKMAERRHELAKRLARHEQLIKNWVAFKEEREKERLYLENMHKSAAIVQAWWRGLLVRYELGPFKPGKQPVKPEKPEKKRKKK